MSGADLPDGISTHLGHDTVSASCVVDAEPSAVFDYVRNPSNHADISGDSSVRGKRVGPEVLAKGDRFGMRMKLWGIPYWIRSKVTEYIPERRIGWAHLGGHTWRWEFDPADGGGTKLTETFDLSTAKLPPALRILGYPKAHEANVARSVANVRDHFATK